MNIMTSKNDEALVMARCSNTHFMPIKKHKYVDHAVTVHCRDYSGEDKSMQLRPIRTEADYQQVLKKLNYYLMLRQIPLNAIA